MSENFTVTKTSEVFDRSKIGVGDIIEINTRMIRCPKMYPVSKQRVPAIVESVHDDAVMLHWRERGRRKRTIEFGGVPVEYAAEITMIYRHPDNVSRKE